VIQPWVKSKKPKRNASSVFEARQECLGAPRRNSCICARRLASIPPEWIGTYFRTWGVYTQGDGLGVVGGTGGEGKAVPYFMVRIRIPNGLLRSDQVRGGGGYFGAARAGSG